MTNNLEINMIIMGLKEQLAYKKTIILRLIMMIIIMIVFSNLWTVVYGSQKVVNGMSYDNALFYLLITEAFFMARPQISYKISDEIKSGAFVYSICRPFNYEMYYFMTSLGDSLFKFITNLFIGCITLLILGVQIKVNVILGILFLIALAMGYTIDYSFQFLIGIFSFKIEEISGFVFIYEKLLFILGGIVFPISMLGSLAKNIFLSLPFAYVIGFPTQILTSTAPNLALLFLIQVSYFIFLLFFTKYWYNKLVSLVTVNGG